MTGSDESPRGEAFAALLDICRLWLGTGSPEALLDRRLDWDVFGRLAFIHNLEPLIHHLRAEESLPRDDIPPALCDRWERAYYENFVFNTRALEIVRPFCAACDRDRLPIAFIKGPITSARIFGDPALRIMVDVDVLCREQDLPRLVHLAREAGFSDGEETAVYHLSLRHEDLPLLLELHFQLYDFLPRPAEILAEILRTSESCDQGDFALPAPPAHIETAIEIAHLVNHDLRVNLKPLLDLAAGLRKPPSTALTRTLGQWKLEPEAAVVSRLLELLFGVRADLCSDAYPARGGPIITPALSAIEHADEHPQKALAELVARPGVGSKIAYLISLLGSSSRRLEALSADDRGPPGGSRLSHLRRAFARGWGKLRRAGFASTRLPSIKRELYRRRRGE